MTVQEFSMILENSDRLRIVIGDKEVFTGFFATLRQEIEVYSEVQTQQVRKFRVIPEIRHRRWKELNLMRPLEPTETPDYSFSDLEMKIYYTIYI